MVNNDFIPTGRTSLVKKGEVALQVQTEYACRPAPRITTTVLDSGRVVHKIDRSVDRPVDSSAEKSRMEVYIQKQHSEVLAIIEGRSELSAAGPDMLNETAPVKLAIKPLAPLAPQFVEKGTHELLADLPGDHRVFRLDAKGHLPDAAISRQFKKKFSSVLKNMHTLLTLFTTLPGPGPLHQAGVYEIERNSLYLISDGDDFYLFYISRPELRVRYEDMIESIVTKEGDQ